MLKRHKRLIEPLAALRAESYYGVKWMYLSLNTRRAERRNARNIIRFITEKASN